MELYPTIKIVFDRRKTSKSTIEGTVELEIYSRLKRKWISTGVKVLPKNWNDKEKSVKGRFDSTELNLRIRNLENIVKSYIMKLMAEGKPFTWQGLEAMLNFQKDDNTFVNFVESMIERRNDITEGTRRNHKKFLKALKEFKTISKFGDLTRQNITMYDEWLHNRRNYTQSTIATYHKYMKIFINEAIHQELITRNPYEGIKIDNGKSPIRRYLTQKEVEQLENAKLFSYSLEKTRDLFIFQCNTGLSYIDMKRFDMNKVIIRDGKYVINETRKKTGEDFYIVLLPKALNILKKYDFKLPMMSNEQYNMRLKIVADSAGLNKRLTSHMGRHTYATMCLNTGIQIEILAKMLGHADIRTTQIYAKILNSSVESAYSILEQSDNIKIMVNSIQKFLDYIKFALFRQDT